MSDNGTRLPIIEALIMSSPEPLPARKIADLIENATIENFDSAVTSLNEKYESGAMSFRIRKIAGGYQIFVIEDYAGYVDELLTRRRNTRLTRSALDTLAIIAYRQPVTKLDIEMIRGVASDSVIHTLLQRKLVTLAGRAQTMGRPLLYRTTEEFLKFFNLNALEDLPKMEEIEELVSSREIDSQPTLPFETATADSDKLLADKTDDDSAKNDDMGEPPERNDNNNDNDNDGKEISNLINSDEESEEVETLPVRQNFDGP